MWLHQYLINRRSLQCQKRSSGAASVVLKVLTPFVHVQCTLYMLKELKRRFFWQFIQTKHVHFLEFDILKISLV